MNTLPGCAGGSARAVHELNRNKDLAALITLIATVLNEGDNIHHLLQSFLRQTRRPDEVIIVDGGSSDNTIAVLESYVGRLNLRVAVQTGYNISAGRNLAIALATHELVAATDAGTKLADDWLEKLTTPLLENPGVQMVGGFFLADPQTAFEVALGATTLPLANEIDPAKFLPSSRSVAFRKAAWQDAGGYPEWLDYCEDLIFDLRMRAGAAQGQGFVFAPNALVYFRPRRSLRAFFRQYYLYARGDGKADLWRKRHAVRYATYLLLLPGILLLGLLLHPLFWGLLLPGVLIYTYRPYRRLPAVLRRCEKRLSIFERLSVLALIPLIRVVGDVAKMLGYPAGWRWRRAQNPPDWRA